MFDVRNWTWVGWTVYLVSATIIGIGILALVAYGRDIGKGLCNLIKELHQEHWNKSQQKYGYTVDEDEHTKEEPR